MDGIINVHKEKGFTSHDVVAKLRGIFHQKKIGHTGTLDPDAVGVLPVCVGRATKVCGLLTDQNKVYTATVRLGVITDTQDMTGRILERRQVLADLEQIKQAAASFVGEIWQTPPMYSAVKVEGKRLYELARQGIEVERKKRKITVYSCDVEEFAPERDEFTMTVCCSKGTYIRTLCDEIGQVLGCGACMASLVRTRSGFFSLENAVTISQIQTLFAENRMDEILIPVDRLFIQYPKVIVSEAGEKLLRNGNMVEEGACRFPKEVAEGTLVRMYDERGSFYAVYRYDMSCRVFRNYKMFFQEGSAGQG